jgi:microcystin-dependent protein
MADPFVAEIRIFPFSFAPKGWASCGGQLLPLSQNTALFSLLGTYYGGDGRSTFALPDLRGRAVMHPGQGPGLSMHGQGEAAGSDTVTLDPSEIPAHSHAMMADTLDQGDFSLPGPATAFAQSAGGNLYQSPAGNTTQLAAQALPPAGGGLPHNNLQPYLTLNFNIALQGVFPPRS